MQESKARSLARKFAYLLVDPPVLLARYLNLSPNLISTLGFGFTVMVAALFVAWSGDEVDLLTQHIGLGSLLLFCSGGFDLIDGRLARLTNQESEFGAFYDSVLDRYGDLVIYSAIGIFLLRQGEMMGSVFALFSLIASVTISYIAAKAATFGIKIVNGYMPREVRLSILTGGGIICGLLGYFLGGNVSFYASTWLNLDVVSIFTASLLLIAVFGNITSVQRILSAYKQFSSQAKG